MGVCRWVLETLDLLQTQRDELESCSWNQLRDKSKSGAYQSLIENNQALWWKSTLIYIPFPERKGYFYTLLQSQGGNKHKNTDLNVNV